ncbi:hypothetical protein TPR58_12360 [Sphingomonas sp. HF-S3]|uniref:Polymerase nucleotidyl transferase domain-containing protein n=1 Tax=Sphingomonas rustica TaxID=3103142 RepID=A0ABV0BAR6_9SPHN
MRIDRAEAICGVSPLVLKRLLSRESFSTPTAMAYLKLSEPQASETMIALMREWWIEHVRTTAHVDHWQSTDQGNRLTATRLIKRFPVREGRAIVDHVIAEAREINGDPDSSCRIAEILLFGSVLTGADDDAGDIDLVVKVARRQLPKAELRRLQEAEKAQMPSWLDFFQRQFRVESELLRRIKKVSGRIGLHPESDIASTGAPFRQVYAFDLASETEAPVDPEIRTMCKEAREEHPSLEAAKSVLPEFSLRATWPVAPNEEARLKHVDQSELDLMQHLWVRGADIAAIAARTGRPSETVQAYLASRANVGLPSAFRFDASLRATVSQALRPRAGYMKLNVELRPGQKPLVDTAYYERNPEQPYLARIRQLAPRDLIVSGRPDLLPLIEPVHELAWQWLERMRPYFKGLGLSVGTGFFPDQGPESLDHPKPVDFRPLVLPLYELLRAQLPIDLERYAIYEHRLVIELGQPLRIDHWVGEPAYGKAKRQRVLKADASFAWEALTALLEKYRVELEGGELLTVTAFGGEIAGADER